MKSAAPTATKTMTMRSKAEHSRGAMQSRSMAGRTKARTVFHPTPREREVLKMVWSGLSNREIADRLGISSRTIEAHRASLMKKLRVANTAQLVRIAIEQGLIKVG